MRATVFCIASQKGGVGKSTTAGALAAALTVRGKKALAIDLDGQCNLTHILNGDRNAPGVLEVLRGEIQPADAIQRTEQADIMAGSKALARFSGSTDPGAWADMLKGLRPKYDYIIIDTPPDLDKLLLYALAKADRVIIPAQAGAGSLESLGDITQTIAATNRQGGKLKVAGVLFTAVNTRKTNAEAAMLDAIRTTCGRLGLPVFNTEIRRADAIRAGECFRQTVIAYDRTSKPAQDYFKLLDEMQL